MIENETVAGRQSAWNLIKKLGEGDAGEVYLVQSASAGRQQNWAILKRPRPSAFTGEMFRQSTQIRAEAKILKALSGAPSFDASLRVHTPTLLDDSKAGAEYNGRNFIVIERARGLDLSFLARVAQVGLSDYAESVAAFGLEDRLLVDAISRSGRIPARLLLAVLYRLARFIDFIHGVRSAEGGGQARGILWNDVKPDHLFWDAQRGVLTVIDWGNARFLEDGQATRDRQFSWADDYRQLFDEMGRYLALPACGSRQLAARLEWPGSFSAESSTPEAIRALHDRLEAALQEEDQNMAEARRSEETLLRADADQEISLDDIQTIQGQVLEFGEAPDFERSLRYTAGFAARLAQADRLDELRTLAGWAANLAGADPQQWQLVDLLARLSGPAGRSRQWAAPPFPQRHPGSHFPPVGRRSVGRRRRPPGPGRLRAGLVARPDHQPAPPGARPGRRQPAPAGGRQAHQPGRAGRRPPPGRAARDRRRKSQRGRHRRRPGPGPPAHSLPERRSDRQLDPARPFSA